MVCDDLEGVLTASVEGGEDGQQTLRGEQMEYRQEEVRRTAPTWLELNGPIYINLSKPWNVSWCKLDD